MVTVLVEQHSGVLRETPHQTRRAAGEKYVRINAARARVFLVGDFRSFAI